MDKGNKRTDRRVIKTKKAIRDAFAKLLAEKEIDNITIKEISEVADINRKTFYSYYSNIDQLVEELENEIATTFATAMDGISFNQFMIESNIVIEKISEIFTNDLEFYSCLLKKGVNTTLYSKFIERIIERTTNSFDVPKDFDINKINIIIRYSISGMISVYQQWMNSDKTVPIGEVSSTISNLFQYGFKGTLKN